MLMPSFIMLFFVLSFPSLPNVTFTSIGYAVAICFALSLPDQLPLFIQEPPYNAP